MMTIFALTGAFVVFVLVDFLLQEAFSIRRNDRKIDLLSWLGIYTLALLLGASTKLGAKGVIVVVSLTHLSRLALLLYRSDRDIRIQYACCLLAVAVAVLGIYIFQAESELALRKATLVTLIWPGADQIFYAAESIKLLEGTSVGLQYAPGYSFFLIPYAGILRFVSPALTPETREGFANHLNMSLLCFHLVVLLPASFMLIARAVSNALGGNKNATSLYTLLTPLFVSACFVLYTLCVPAWMAERNSVLGFRRLLGLTFGPETLSLLLFAFLLAFAASNRAINRKQALVLGSVTGLALLVSERNVAFVLPFLVVSLLLIPRSSWRSAFETIAAFGVTGLAFVSAYPIYMKLVYGGFFVSARSVHWEVQDKAVKWAKRIPDLYPSLELAAPPRMSALYVPENFSRLLQGYGVILLVFAAAISWQILSRHKDVSVRASRVNLGIVSLGTAAITLAVCLSYINPNVGFRYYACLIPVFAIMTMLSVSDLLTSKPLTRLGAMINQPRERPGV
ncbi:hypothetical protein AB4072_10100 [Microvirga sp. 2MCAF38]|uniref:hypothetical protein n=1 Tax=Microvirga sp. 2MCAF38 TaxID=3232989 RepID=UPI003F966D1F